MKLYNIFLIDGKTISNFFFVLFKVWIKYLVYMFMTIFIFRFSFALHYTISPYIFSFHFAQLHTTVRDFRPMLVPGFVATRLMQMQKRIKRSTNEHGPQSKP